MKKLLVVFAAFTGIYSCSPRMQSYSGEVSFISKEEQGTILVKSTGYGKNRNDAILDAQKNAFQILLFKGLPGTELNVPLVENENNARSKNPEYFKKLLDECSYKAFMMSSTESSNLIKIRGAKKITMDLKVNYNSFRKDLEQNQVIRKFGY